MTEVIIKIRKDDKSVELTLAELQDLHSQIEALSSVAKCEDYEEGEDW